MSDTINPGTSATDPAQQPILTYTQPSPALEFPPLAFSSPEATATGLGGSAYEAAPIPADPHAGDTGGTRGRY